MKKPTPRQLIVVRKALITPHMMRVTLGGSQMEGFPRDRASANCKLLLPSDDLKPAVRTYTVRRHRCESAEVDIDFVLHADQGPASNWALSVEAGERVGFAGPGRAKLVNNNADWFLFAGDMSALPAISANIEQLPQSAQGCALLEILAEDDRQPLDFPEGLQVEWLVNPEPCKSGSALCDAVMARPWLPGRVAAWVAGESGTTKAIRRYLKQERNVPKEDLYASGYWQIGLTEDRHQLVKREEAEG